MKNAWRVLMGLGGIVFLATLGAPALLAQEVSHARIVRLSYAEGTVTVSRPDVAGWATAPVNTPLQEGYQLATADGSFAEVEFENTSTARLGQNSLLSFDQLALDSSGAKINRLTLTQGYATFTFKPGDDDINEVKVGDATVTLTERKTTVFRADLDQGALRVEVFRGVVNIASPYGNERLDADNVFELNPGADQPVNITRGITKDDWDAWVADREKQTEAARNYQAPGIYSTNVNSLYGWGDLNGYGTWGYVSGYGYGWIPYVSAGWMPYSYGRWCWIPGFGYTWISYEPWGWLPFHYGGWVYQPGLGWVWIPDNFGFWSPGLVSWYQGPGWVGWTPMPPRTGTNTGTTGTWSPIRQNCPLGKACITAVGTDTFRAGRPVWPNRMTAFNPDQGSPMAQPDIEPTAAGRLTGAPVRGGFARPTVSEGAQGAVDARRVPATAGRTAMPAATGAATPASPARTGAFGRPGAATSGGVVFDPASGQYVNDHGPARGDAPAAAHSGGVPARGVSPTGVTTPGSETSSPRTGRGAAAPTLAPVEPSHHAAPAGSVESTPSAGDRPSGRSGGARTDSPGAGVRSESPSRGSSGAWSSRPSGGGSSVSSGRGSSVSSGGGASRGGASGSFGSAGRSGGGSGGGSTGGSGGGGGGRSASAPSSGGGRPHQ